MTRPDGQWISVGLLLLACSLRLQSQSSSNKAGAEQSSFGGEEVPGIPFIKRGRIVTAVTVRFDGSRYQKYEGQTKEDR
jgi:hypothetical protein